MEAYFKIKKKLLRATDKVFFKICFYFQQIKKFALGLYTKKRKSIG